MKILNKMPASAVYQPTTVTYEQQREDERWQCQFEYFVNNATRGMSKEELIIIAGCTLGGLCLTLGSGILIGGGVQMANAPDTTEGQPCIIAGSVLFTFGALLLCISLVWRSYLNKRVKESGEINASALSALNPSMDVLVSTQYAPVRDAPPAPEEEMHILMDNKDCISSPEESDQMLNGRPSIA